MVRGSKDMGIAVELLQLAKQIASNLPNKFNLLEATKTNLKYYAQRNKVDITSNPATPTRREASPSFCWRQSANRRRG